MTLFDALPSDCDLWPASAPSRRRLVEGLLGRFQAAFPDIAYDVLWQTPVVNAQAFWSQARPHVRLYGGLARHRRASAAGIAYALAHETGHHLGGAPRHEIYIWLSSEARADAWAEETGLEQVLGHELGQRYAKLGRRQLARLLRLNERGGVVLQGAASGT